MPENKWTVKRRYWARLLQELADSGLPVREFARKRKVHERVLRRWMTMAKRGTWVPGEYLDDPVELPEVASAEGPPAAEVSVPEPGAPLEIVPVQAFGESGADVDMVSTILPVTLIGPPSAELTYELTFAGRQLRLPRDFEVQRVARLVRALEAAGSC